MADRIFTMEARHRRALRSRLAEQLGNKSIVNLGIPDRYRFMDDALVRLLKERLARHLP
ncbi:hypothetical protein [Erythrobacter sp. HI0063]|uniref:hypothetical protein n=1 Tax=Erythrobacter sp. HI0063 TaxID=1822240 RepID=UPI000ACC85C7|nr:hypothetical protein [Erythrobacter sp. HI0063]